MKCPNCNSDTPDISNACEWCGAALYQDAGAEQTPGDMFDRQAAYQFGYGLIEGGETPPPPGAPGYAPGDASYQGYGQPGPYRQPGPPPPAQHRPWYQAPWPYVIAIAIVLIAIVAVVAMQHSSSSQSAASAAFVVNGKPTLLDFYTDT